MEDTMEIDLKVLFQTVKRHLLVIIMMGIIGGMAALGYAHWFITPMYRASAMMIVNNSSVVNTNNITSSDISASKSLADTYAIIIKSDAVLAPVVTDLALQKSTTALASHITVESVNETQIVKILYQDASPEEARQVVQEILNVAPDIIVDKVGATSCKIVSDATVTTRPVSPNLKKMILIGAVIGAMLTAVLFVVKELMDDTISSDEQLAQITGVPNLGIVYKM